MKCVHMLRHSSEASRSLPCSFVGTRGKPRQRLQDRYADMAQSQYLADHSTQARNICGNLGQIIVKLMPTPIEFTNGCLWKLFCMHRKMRERHDLVVTAMVKEYWE